MKAGQARVCPVNAGLDLGAEQEQRAGLAVVGAAAGVLRYASTELGERHDHYAVVQSMRSERVHQALHAGTERCK